MLHTQLRSGLAHVGLALREPEEFTRRWHGGEMPYSWWVFLALALTAVLGTSTYGLTMGILGGPGTILLDAVRCTTAAGLAWGIALPSLYIFNSLSGSRLKPSTTLLATLVTTSWGGLAMIASIPINWFFTVALHDVVVDPTRVTWLVRGVNLVVFTGVGISMIDIFGRVIAVLEPERGAGPFYGWWLSRRSVVSFTTPSGCFSSHTALDHTSGGISRHEREESNDANDDNRRAIDAAVDG